MGADTTSHWSTETFWLHDNNVTFTRKKYGSTPSRLATSVPLLENVWKLPHSRLAISVPLLEKE